MLQEMAWNICWNVHGLTWHVTFKPFSSYSIHCTCTYAQRSWQRIIISRADRERCKGFRIPMKNSYLLNSLSKIIENNKPQPVPLFRFLGNILYTRICLIFFSNLNLSDLFSLSEVWCDHEDIVPLNYWTKP